MSPVVAACSDALQGFTVRWLRLGGAGGVAPDGLAGQQLASYQAHAGQLLAAEQLSSEARISAAQSCLVAAASAFRGGEGGQGGCTSSTCPVQKLQPLPPVSSDIWLEQAADGTITNVPPAAAGCAWHVDLLHRYTGADAAPAGDAGEMWCAEHLLSVYLPGLQPRSVYAATVQAYNRFGSSALTSNPQLSPSCDPSTRPLRALDSAQQVLLFETLGAPTVQPPVILLQGTGVGKAAVQWLLPRAAAADAATLACELQVSLLRPLQDCSAGDGRPRAITCSATLDGFPCEQEAFPVQQQPVEATVCFTPAALPQVPHPGVHADDTQCPLQGSTPRQWQRDGSRHFMKVQGLPHDTCVAVRWRCLNAVGPGPWSDWCAGIWTHGPPSIRMPAVTCLQPLSTPSSVAISFVAATRGHHDAVISYYEARLAPASEVHDSEAALWQVCELGSTTAAVGPSREADGLVHTLSGLDSDTHYAVCVRAVNAVGQGEWSLPAHVWSAGPPTVPPQAPRLQQDAFDGALETVDTQGSLSAQAHSVQGANVDVAGCETPTAAWSMHSLLVCGIGVTCVQLQWRSCELGHHDDPITHYRVLAVPQGEAASGQQAVHLVAAQEDQDHLACRFEGLQSSGVYCFALQAVNAVGTGPIGAYTAPVQLLGAPALAPQAPWVSSAVQRHTLKGAGSEQAAMLPQPDTCEATSQGLQQVTHGSLPLCWHHCELATQSDMHAAPYDRMHIQVQGTGDYSTPNRVVSCSVLRLGCPAPLLQLMHGGGQGGHAEHLLDACTLDGLPANTAFRVRMAWGNCAGVGPWSTWSRTAWTLGPPTTAPPPPTPHQRGLDWLSLRWPDNGAAVLGHHDALPQRVTVQWRSVADAGMHLGELLACSSVPDAQGKCTLLLQSPPDKSQAVNSDGMDITITCLPCNTAFSVRLRFENDVGSGEWGGWSDEQSPLAHTLGPPSTPPLHVLMGVSRQPPCVKAQPPGALWSPLALDGALTVGVVTGTAGEHDAPLTAVRVTWILVSECSGLPASLAHAVLLPEPALVALSEFAASPGADVAETRAAAQGHCKTVLMSDLQALSTGMEAALPSGCVSGMLSLEGLPAGQLLLLRVRWVNAAGQGPPGAWPAPGSPPSSKWANSMLCHVSEPALSLVLPPPLPVGAAARTLAVAIHPPPAWSLHDVPPLLNKSIQDLSSGTSYVLQTRFCFRSSSAPISGAWGAPSVPMQPLQAPPCPNEAALSIESVDQQGKLSYVPLLGVVCALPRSDAPVGAPASGGLLQALRLMAQLAPLSPADLASRTMAMQKDPSCRWVPVVLGQTATLEVLCRGPGANASTQHPCELLPLGGDIWNSSKHVQLHDIAMHDTGADAALGSAAAHTGEQAEQMLATLTKAAQQALQPSTMSATGLVHTATASPPPTSIRGVLRLVVSCLNSAGESSTAALPWMPVRIAVPHSSAAVQRYCAALSLKQHSIGQSGRTTAVPEPAALPAVPAPAVRAGITARGEPAANSRQPPAHPRNVGKAINQPQLPLPQVQAMPAQGTRAAGLKATSQASDDSQAAGPEQARLHLSVWCSVCESKRPLGSRVCCSCGAPLPTQLCLPGGAGTSRAPSGTLSAAFPTGKLGARQWRRCCMHAVSSGTVFPVAVAPGGVGPKCGACGTAAAHLGCVCCTACGCKLP